jgi:hypothetical protein
MVRPFKKA